MFNVMISMKMSTRMLKNTTITCHMTNTTSAT